MKKITGFVRVVALGFNVTVVAFGVTVIADVLALDTTPSATIKLSGGPATAGVGVDRGRGTLTCQGMEYPICVNGISVGDVGVASIEASGKVFDLKSLRDFDANYTTVDTTQDVRIGASSAK